VWPLKKGDMCTRYLVTLLSLCCVSVTCIYLPQQLLQGRRRDGQFEAASIDLPLDHFNPTDDRTFPNRFWISTTFYQPGGPVFFYDAGERGVSDSETVLSSTSHPLMRLTESFHGAAIVWEHRYYGLSSPFPGRLNGTQEERQEAYQYLNTEQALEDTVYFASHFKPNGLEEHWDSLGPEATPWIWIGGSYPGQRGAMIRRRNPEIFFASWSSSANVEIKESLPEYYLRISRYLPEDCRAVVQAFVKQVDGVLKDGQRLEKYRFRWAIARRWSAETYTYWERVIFALAAPDIVVASHIRGLIAADWQWEGLEGRMGTTCAAIRLSAANLHSDLNTYAAIDTVLDAIEANNRFFDLRSKARQVFPLDAEAWTYQSCTEYFDFHTAADDDPSNILSSIFTTESMWKTDCERLFPWLSPPSDSDVPVPARYAGWDKNVSRVMFTTGLEDPWHDVSMVPSEGLVPGSPRQRTMTQVVLACDRAMAGDEVFGLLFEKGRHCSDLVPGTEETVMATELFSKALRSWLPCF
jgi:hypothetical protein